MYISSKAISIPFSVLGCLFFLVFFSNCCTKVSLCIKNETEKNIRVVSNMKGKSVDDKIDFELYPHRKKEMYLFDDIIVFSENDCIEIIDAERFFSDNQVKKEHVLFPDFSFFNGVGCLSGVVCNVYIKGSNGKIYYDYSSND